MDELKKIVDMVAGKNYIWVILTFGEKNTVVHTAHNGTGQMHERALYGAADQQRT